MGIRFSVAPQELTDAGHVLRTAQQQADRAVLAFTRSASAVTGNPRHAGIGTAAATFGNTMASALADLGRSAEGLGSAVDTSARICVTTDSDLAYRYAALSGP